MTPFAMPLTAQPAWVHLDENALYVPAFGWVTTTPLSANTLPPPSGMSAVLASSVPAAFPAAPLSDPVVEALSSAPHAVSAAASPAAPTAATTVRRAGVCAEWSDSLVILAFPSERT